MRTSSTDCGKCPLAGKCYMKDKYQRLDPYDYDGGMGLCPKLEVCTLINTDWLTELTCANCHFKGKVGDRGGAKIRNFRTCELLEGPGSITQNIATRKRNCPLVERVRKEMES